ncbi:protein-methionine-sulfoxide reductase heme-binding subunit MsrQ (plasmid) [Methylomagnum ishizawai]|nr:protein-methionine-sulfoxide reductase heme-binding subunit MsrQ [Methylomagnum ishizawai]BBL77269.1 protein-methionine-sulfoxide reductase heme-binding subunit MsrQ [Methylomagnum ishizawai]
MSVSTGRNPSKGWLRGAKILAFWLSLLPLVDLVWAGAADALGANPIEKITRDTGWWTLAFLMIGLAVTPARKLSGWSWLGRFRRMLGLFAFFYACLHLATYLALDQFFAWTEILADIVKRPYITVGSAAFVMLVPLAATSTDGMVRRLGGQRWKRLHRCVYLIAVCGVVHFWWLVKKDLGEPAGFAAILSASLLARLDYTPFPKWGLMGPRWASSRGASKEPM